MLAGNSTRRQSRSLRFREPLWDHNHPDWLSLDSRLAHDHRVRLIARILDLFDFQPLLADFYAGFGSCSYHPRVYLAVLLFELDRGRLSPAQWTQDCRDCVPLLWLLQGACPSRSSLYQCRNRFPPALLEQLNAQLLRLATQEQLCPVKAASLDGTFVAARGSRHQMLNLKRLDKRLGLLKQALDPEEGHPAIPRPGWMARTQDGKEKQQTRFGQARRQLLDKIERHRKRQSRRAKKKRQGDDRVLISVSEAEAAIGKDKTRTVRPLYNVQVLRELESGFILGYSVLASNSDVGLLPGMLERTRRLVGTLPQELLADGSYASVSDLRACKEQAIILYAPLGQDQRSEPARRRVSLPMRAEAEGPDRQPPKPPQGRGYYAREKFVWDEATRSYTCPAAERLQRVTKGKSRRGDDDGVEVEIFATPACPACAQKSACTRSKTGRRIKRMVEEPLVEALRQRMRTEEGKQRYQRRKETIEWVFADFKEHRGLRRFSSFGRKRAETTVALLVFLHNAKTLLRARQAASAAA